MSKCNGPKHPHPGDIWDYKEDPSVWELESHRHYLSFEYEEKCSNCGKTHLVQTQQDENPEYYTTVFVKCQCGNDVQFTLPVN